MQALLTIAAAMPIPSKISGPSVQTHISPNDAPGSSPVKPSLPQAPQRTARTSQGELGALSARGTKRPRESSGDAAQPQAKQRRADLPRSELPRTHGDADSRMERIMQMQAETMIRSAEMQNVLNRANAQAKLMEEGAKAAKDLIN
ncbi:hypothetical protein [Ralstonia sp. 1B3]|jgi:hypothetical protein|uniref:Type III effector protein n=2 Tax=Ralstonia edaphi TaxID=3058599 RepID=A0AB72X1F1_9RALS|nr:hypothetical protein R16034_00521 [Ralstonia sp. LMG 6871]